MLRPLFTGKLLRLAAPLPEDKAVVAEWTRDDEYMRNLDDDPVRPLSPDAWAALEAQHAEGRILFHLRTLADDRLIGFAAIHNISWSSQFAEFAIGIGVPEYRGKGYGQDALQLLLNYAFSELNFYRMGLTVMAYNEKAIKAYERAGFVKEGVRRGAVQRDGARHDVLLYGILRDEWEAHRAAQEEASTR